MNEQTQLSCLMVQHVARLVAEGRHQDLPGEILSAYTAQTGKQVPAPSVAAIAPRNEAESAQEPRPARATRNGPFCWQSKSARRAIRAAFDATNNVATALAVYDAITEIASDAQSETFTTTHAWIQQLSGVGISTIKKHLGILSELGLVSITTPSVRAPSTYTLLSIANDCPTLANHCPSIANEQLTLANAPQSAPLATSEESQKNLRRTNEETPWADLPPVLQTSAFKAAWSDFTRYRKEAKLRPLKPRSVVAQWQTLSDWGEPVAIERIRETIRQGWQGIHPPKAVGSRFAGTSNLSPEYRQF